MILAAMRSKNDSLCGASNVEAAKSSKYFIAVLLVYYFVIKLYYVNIRFDLLSTRRAACVLVDCKW